MYEKYQTEALVLRSYERGEADRVYALFTREFGYLWARASAVRRENSRQRYALQNGARTTVSLVRGKRGWRIAGALAEDALNPHEVGTSVFTRVALLVERLVHGEESNQYLFDVLKEARRALMQEDVARHSSIELLTVARILFSLGYLSTEAFGSALFLETAYVPKLLEETQSQRIKLLSSVNKALGETQL